MEADRRFESRSGRCRCLKLSDLTGQPLLRHLWSEQSTAPETDFLLFSVLVFVQYIYI